MLPPIGVAEVSKGTSSRGRAGFESFQLVLDRAQGSRIPLFPGPRIQPAERQCARSLLQERSVPCKLSSPLNRRRSRTAMLSRAKIMRSHTLGVSIQWIRGIE